ncbi:enoyl-CoA hydratase/isomerase family protein [Nitriliruptor alkaliphilus]|uniref:enoyl-CoA hydratase/isomerase family protein n=1 Tax=Nitriliruptor alkaliphilus TaxID=427918 RepID=UPI0006977CF1|nr:enoyl-CoA hydratase/isomerase family protein [Nitriliruptor alkaliphilus]
MSGAVRVQDEAGVRLLTLDRPQTRNAIDVATQGELRERLVAAALDADVRAIVLTGQDPAFSAGGDLSRFGDDVDPTAFRFASHELTATIGLVERIEKPVLAAINGVATGAGAQLALACDVRIASERARFLHRESFLGLLPAHGGIVRLVHLIGLARARDVVLGGEDLDAEAALRAGLVSELVAHDDLLPRTLERARSILERSPDAYAAAKRVLNLAPALDLHAGMAVETLGQSLLVTTDEHLRRLGSARRRQAGG